MNGARERAVTKLPGTEAAVPAARRFTSQTIAQHGLHGEVLEKAQLLVTELATNSVLHAHSPIRLSVMPRDHHVRVEVRDDDPTPLRQPHRPEVDAEHGRGLWLVDALSRDWGINSNEKGKTIWFEVG